MHLVLDSAFLKNLGWSLADSVWQIGILWVLYILITANGKRYNSTIRHSLALLSLAGGSICFVIDLVLRFSSAVSSPETALPGLPGQIAGLLKSILPSMDSFLPVLSAAYLLIVVILFFRLLKQYTATRNLQTRGLSKASGQLRIFFRDIIAQMGIRGNVKIWLSSIVDTPMTIGFLKPVVLLPIAMINQLSTAQVEAIILHELNHIRRNDYLVNLLVAFSDIIFFFNPFARLLAGIIKKERENSCDDMVLQFRYKPSEYADALLLLEKNRLKDNRLALAAMGTNHFLFQRVKRILTGKPVSQPLPQRLIAGLAAITLLAFIGWYHPANKEAEIKPQYQVADFEEPGWENQQVIAKMPPPTPNESLTPHEQKAINKNEPQAVQLQQDADEYVILQHIIDQYREAQKRQADAAADQAKDGFATFATELQARAFSIPENGTPDQEVNESGIHPYVPESSFSYQIVEDTSLPKKYIMTHSELKAREAMDKAIQALHEIDWQKLEKDLKASGQNLDVVKLQKQIKKAITEVDWKKINQEAEASADQLQSELLNKQDALELQIELLRSNQKDRVEKLKSAREKIIQERLMDTDNRKNREEKQEIRVIRRIVYI